MYYHLHSIKCIYFKYTVLWVLTMYMWVIYQCNFCHNQERKPYHYPQTFPGTPLLLFPTSARNHCPRQLLICFPSLQISWDCSKISKKWNQSYRMYFFCVWFLSLMTMFLRFILVMLSTTNCFPFSWVKGGAVSGPIRSYQVRKDKQNPLGPIRTMVTLCV